MGNPEVIGELRSDRPRVRACVAASLRTAIVPSCVTSVLAVPPHYMFDLLMNK